MSRKACVVGAGPNGLAAAIVLAQAGFDVDVFEAEPTPGGAARTLPLTLPGFLHDFGSAVHPWVVGSPFFSSLPLRDYGLECIHPPAPLAHPLDDGTAVVLERSLGDSEAALGADGKAWRRLMKPFVEHWQEFAPEVLQPIHLFSRHPLLMARFGLSAFRSAESLASAFRDERTRALFAGLAAHSFLKMDDTLSGAFGILLGVSAHAVGWPIPRGGSQSITNALCGYLAKLGGKVKASTRIENLETLRDYEFTLCDVTPRQLLRIASGRLSNQYRRRLEQYRYGPAAFKVDYALSQPIPWRARECERAGTIHLGGSFAEIAASEKAMATGQPPERPFMILAQPSLFDATRAPSGKHTVWAYCHVPNGSTFDMLPRMEAQIERFAPGFRDCVLARKVFSPADLESMDANLVGGDIGGGAMDLRQFLFRPTRLQYATSAKDIFLCSASTPPGAGVHGMCGYHAARLAVSRMKGKIGWQEMFKILMVAFIVIVAVLASTHADTQNCVLSGTATWSPQMRDIIADCKNRFPSPDNHVILEVGTQGDIKLFAEPESQRLELTARRIEAPAMVVWSPTSDAFFVNDGEDSGMSSVFRLFRLKADHVVEDDSIGQRAVALYRHHVRCNPHSADPNVWGFGWTPDGRRVFVLVQATTDDPCGRSEWFVTLVVSETDGVILETLSKEKSRERFAHILPPDLLGK